MLLNSYNKINCGHKKQNNPKSKRNAMFLLKERCVPFYYQIVPFCVSEKDIK